MFITLIKNQWYYNIFFMYLQKSFTITLHISRLSYNCSIETEDL